MNGLINYADFKKLKQLKRPSMRPVPPFSGNLYCYSTSFAW